MTQSNNPETQNIIWPDLNITDYDWTNINDYDWKVNDYDWININDYGPIIKHNNLY